MSAARLEQTAWIVGAVGLISSTLVWLRAPDLFPHAWLAAVVGWIGWPLGSVALILIHALTGGRWGFAIRAPLLVGAATLPLIVLFAAPVLLTEHALYPWMRPEIAARLDNTFYLNARFFYIRAAIYGVVWIGVDALVLRAVRSADPQQALYRLAPPGLVLLALTITFASIDYTLSMEPMFKSSIYGMIAGSEAVLLALSIAVLAAVAGVSVPEGAAIERLGKLMLGLLVFWAYLDFMQFLIVWQSDLPTEAGWYARRMSGGWAIVAALVAALHFVLPFFALLWPQVQRSRRGLAWLAAVLVAIEIPRAWWIVIPASGRAFSWLDIAPMLAIAGLSAALALHFSARRERGAS